MELQDVPNITGPVHIGLPPARTRGIYFLIDDGEIAYVGQSSDIRGRIGQHLVEGLKRFDAIWFLLMDCGSLDRIERRCIEAYRPKYNKCGHSKFLTFAGAEPIPLKVIKKRAPRTRTEMLVIV